MDIVKRNLFCMLRTAAFGTNETAEPMSTWKWQRLLICSNSHGVLNLIEHAVGSQPQSIVRLIPPRTQFAELFGNAGDDERQTEKTAANEPENLPRLANMLLNHRLKSVRNKERHAIDTSVETLRLLDIIVNNTACMLNRGMWLSGIIALGQYLRKSGDKVDFVKLEAWLAYTKTAAMAEVQGSILMHFFGFEQDELPFVSRYKSSAREFVVRSISQPVVHGNRNVLRQSLRCFPFAPLESLSNITYNFAKKLSELEE